MIIRAFQISKDLLKIIIIFNISNVYNIEKWNLVTLYTIVIYIYECVYILHKFYIHLPVIPDDCSCWGCTKPTLGSACRFVTSWWPSTPTSSWSRLLWKSSLALRPNTFWFFVLPCVFNEKGLEKVVAEVLGDEVLLYRPSWPRHSPLFWVIYESLW